MRRTTIVALVSLSSGLASAQDLLWQWDVTYSDPLGEINSADDTVTALLSAQYNRGVQFAHARFDITSNGLSTGQLVGTGDFSNGTGGNPILDVSVDSGFLAGDAISGIEVSQDSFAQDPSSSFANPIPVFRLTWSTSDITAREITVQTANHSISRVYTNILGDTVDIASDQASFTINVVPAPASAALLAMGGMALGSRRR